MDEAPEIDDDDLVKALDLEDLEEQLKDYPGPRAKVVALIHDVPLICKAMTDAMSDDWHNTAATVITERFAVMAEAELQDDLRQALLVEGNMSGGVAKEIVQRHLAIVGRLMFQAGVLVGEGPEHIDKCSCKPEKN